jgi:hypothetical protein
MYHSYNINEILIKYTRLKWAEHVGKMEEGSSSMIILVRKPTGKRPLERPGINGRTILG